jgi:diaminohydroxyphosphoribosylaminopyrimidine deaminase / 5-amino-6-(5-phosphoribosylamino)uracil reductase
MSTKNSHEYFMSKCIDHARQGIGYVSPNPMVGCVIVKNGNIVGYGYHKRYGASHAEVNALRMAGEKAKGATLYVNIEPCNHYGKTPPCTDLIISKKIRCVVVAMQDPNPLVNGQGIKKLKKADVEVIENIFSDQAKILNEHFTKFITLKLPFVTIKIGETFDGRIADAKGRSKWITNEAEHKYVHELRSTYDAVLVGAGTIIKDDPLLTVRHTKGRNPYRIIIDGNLSSPLTSQVFKLKDIEKTIIFISEDTVKSKKNKISKLNNYGVNVIHLPDNEGRLAILTVLKKLHQLNIGSVLVEGGAQVFSQFIEQNLADKLILAIAPKIIGSGIQSVNFKKLIHLNNATSLVKIKSFVLGDNVMIEAYFKNTKG